MVLSSMGIKTLGCLCGCFDCFSGLSCVGFMLGTWGNAVGRTGLGEVWVLRGTAATGEMACGWKLES